MTTTNDDDLSRVTDETHLFENAILDSVAVLVLVSGLEKEFGTKLSDTAVFSESFGTVGGIVRMLMADNQAS